MSPDKYIFTLLLSDFFLRQTYLLSLHPSVNSSNVFSVTVTKYYDFATLSAIFFFLLFVKTQEKKKRRTLRSEATFGSCKSFKNNEKCFLFHLKSSFCSQDIYVFVLTFWSCNKRLIRKIRLISNLMRSQPGSQTIVIHILLNISRSKGKFQTLKFALLVETFFLKIWSISRNIFLKKSSTKCN